MPKQHSVLELLLCFSFSFTSFFLPPLLVKLDNTSLEEDEMNGEGKETGVLTKIAICRLKVTYRVKS